ncbi:efflux RND transporter periplasmic adaptor subunit [Pontimicrobium aquaticum]|uniref:Efflux RND transporter periplasmic adaptor subunit n=1 Tax=Pontimicrobium aquaticum TaxID=2565367 RepID=A0A4U0F1A4_9FLAO|nr:efflux RND transporter periplasmic adaptor subunit [Pontimicrobium aquaticum]TJY38040.1 efflux RND transporter periplasmic adaptor subunit [Pontimicrobium aquaticum]
MKHIYSILFLLVILSCGNSEKEEVSIETQSHQEEVVVSASQFESENMALGELSTQDFNQTVTATGFIDVPPSSRASVTAFMEGYIKNTPLLIGDEVKKGQLLVTLENPEFVELQQNYLEVFNQLTYLKSEFERQETLYKENITSQKNYLKAESDYKGNLAHYNGLKQRLKMLNINPSNVENGNISSTINLYAPIAGSITKVNVSNGSFVSASTEILEIVNTNHIHLELMVFEKDILKIKKEQSISFKVPEASNNAYKAEVYLVGTSIDVTDRTIKIHGHIEDDENSPFVTGMFVEAQIITDASSGNALPKEAVAKIDGAFYALVLQNQDDGYAFEKTKVAVGKQTEAFVEVLNTQDFKDKQVLTKGTFMLLSGGE